jgi:hypothetical protein
LCACSSDGDANGRMVAVTSPYPQWWDSKVVLRMMHPRIIGVHALVSHCRLVNCPDGSVVENR